MKLAGVIVGLGAAARVVHTGQHFSPALGAGVLAQLGLPGPVAQLEVGGGSRGAQVGEATRLLDQHFADTRPAVVVVQGDTNAALAGALAANAREIPLVHVEAGLRSFDRAMPEEHNRVVVDHLSDLCLAPTETSRANLAAEGIVGARVEVTGNTVVEAVQQWLPDVAARRHVLEARGLASGGFVLATIHRPENVDRAEPLAAILGQLADLAVPVVLPLHPRTAASAARFGLVPLLDRLTVTEPLGYAEFLALAAEAALLVSDSGGIQEEASVIKRPVLVVRVSTERPEVLGTFAERVLPGEAIGAVARAWLDDLPGLHARLAVEPSPYGDGSASARCVAAVQRLLDHLDD